MRNPRRVGEVLQGVPDANGVEAVDGIGVEESQEGGPSGGVEGALRQSEMRVPSSGQTVQDATRSSALKREERFESDDPFELLERQEEQREAVLEAPPETAGTRDVVIAVAENPGQMVRSLAENVDGRARVRAKSEFLWVRADGKIRRRPCDVRGYEPGRS